MTVHLIMTKQGNRLDASIRNKAYAFLQKITEDDTTPGLHIEPINNSRDPRVRTGRVDQQYRAVLFKLSAGGDTTYVFHGIWNHDDAIEVAKKTVLRVNPINGIPEIRDIEDERELAGLPPVPEAEPENRIRLTDQVAEQVPGPDTAVVESSPTPLLAGVSRADLIEILGLPASVTDAALAATTEDDVLDAAAVEPEWERLALLGLAAGMDVNEVIADLGLRDSSSPHVDTTTLDEPAAAVDGPSDAELLTSLELPAAQIEFARINGAEELRRVIESGDFGAWRVFLHPEQRKFAEQSSKGPFRLSGGAGTGKTVVLLHRARRLLRSQPLTYEQGLGSRGRPRTPVSGDQQQSTGLASGAPANKDWSAGRDGSDVDGAAPRVVMTTYTVNLADAMKRDLLRLDPTLPIADRLGESGAYVAGIDAIARQVLRAAGTEAVRSAVESVLGVGHADVVKPTDHTAWATAIATAGADLPEKLRSPRFFEAEYALVILPGRITDRDDYLRVRRPGRGVRLSRAERAAVWQVVEAYRLASRINGTVDFQEAAAIAAACLDAAAATADGHRVADHVLIDEGQDMTPCHWQLVRALAAPGPDDLFIAEDSHQRIYGNKVTLSHYGISIVGRSRRLTLNYRTTAQNLHYAVTILSGGTYEDLEADPESTGAYRSARSGPKPVLNGLSSLSDELDFAAETVASWSASQGDDQLETIAVLVRDSRQRDLVVTGLAERGVLVRAVDRDQTKPGAPVVMTMHRAKGTEFAKVLLFGVSHGSLPIGLKDYEFSDDDKADALLRERSLLYVAASRARDELVVTWSGRPSDLMPKG
ncbi:MAG TPA: 3'-5' exonuclease [Propionibacteriaceae bacterium]|nr:3'-5' exonuclease [Propionibacteriaceae bacterium]